MRFAVSLLTLLGIASIIGTVLKQNEPYTNYIVKFGQFWFELFEMLGLLDVYHAAWFLVILLFLVISTTLCVMRNAPLMIKEWQVYKSMPPKSHCGCSAIRPVSLPNKP
jgi:cytochrome c biogenesis protein